MPKIFRKIRSRLLRENRFSRYLIYAIGEIILVVIGILIALQINNWNDIKKKRQLEIRLLKELQTDLHDTAEEIQERIEDHNRRLHYGKRLFQIIRSGKNTNDSLTMFYTHSISEKMQLYPKTSGFDYLKTVGLDKISNDSLRKSITSMYQFEFKRLQEVTSNDSQINLYNIGIQDHYNYIRMDTSKIRHIEFNYVEDLVIDDWQIKDFEILIQDQDLIRRTQQILLVRSRKLEYLQEVISEIDILQHSITDELNELIR